MIWVRVIPEGSESGEGSLQYYESHDIGDISLSPNNTGGSDVAPPQEPSTCSGAKTCGTLLDGTPYVVYRILLYCDDFQKSSAMNSKGSAGGCYFLPMSLPPEARRNTSSVRIITLTPPGVSTNQVLHYIVDDLVHGSVHGVDGYTPTGLKVKIFLDVLGFIGDYPASSSVVDVVGHVSRTPCTVCSFRRPVEEEADGSRYGHSREVHANNSAFMRNGERHISLRASDISDKDAKVLGMVTNDKFSQSTCPLLYLQQKMESSRSRSVLTADGIPVLLNCFDAFRCNFIAPDHLLTGLAKDILNAFFKSLPTKTLRKKGDAYICAALRDNNLLRQKQVYNHKKNKLHSMTLSELFCVLAASVPTFRVLVRECPPRHISRDCFQILHNLQCIVALTFWWPVRELDGEKAVRFVHIEKENYFSDLKAMSKRYVRDVDVVCGKSDVVKKELDKPNLHRLIELYEHTIPAFGHVREVMELVFESAHQPLKRCIARSNNKNAHLFAVEHCVGNDWQGRIATQMRRISHEDDAIRVAARRGLRRTLLGEQADMLDEEKQSNLLTHIDAKISNLFTPALRKQFERDGMISNFGVEKVSVWKAREKIEIKELCTFLSVTPTEAKKMVDKSKQWIDSLYPPISESSLSPSDQEGGTAGAKQSISLFRKARRRRETRSGRQIGTPSGHDTISANSVCNYTQNQVR